MIQLAEKHHFDKKSDFASKFMKSRDYGVAPISGKSSCGMFLSAVRSTYSGCAQTSKYQVLGLDEFQSVISVKPIKEQRRSSFKDVFHGSSIFSALTRNETEKENVQTPLSSRKGVTSNGSSKTSHRSRHRVSRQSSMKSTLYHLSSFEFDNVIGDNFISDCLIGSCQSGVRKERPGDISRGQSVPISSSENSIVRIDRSKSSH
jgi:hypothetical protein